MKKAYLLLALGLMSVAACKKNDNSNVKLPVGYVVNGVSDVTIERDSMASLPVSIELQTGMQEQVTVKVTGLPANVTATVSPESGTPDYMAEITFRASFEAVTGKYPVTVTASSASGSKEYKLTLNIVPISECAMRVMGTYDAMDMCDTNQSTPYTVFVTPVTGKANRVNLQGFFQSSTSIYANLDCNSRTFTIPKQSLMFYEITGSGTYGTNDSMTINYTVTSPFDTVMCTTGLKK